jgi:ribosome-associated toxin RatA of RatAB toxin-antitoxin module
MDFQKLLIRVFVVTACAVFSLGAGLALDPVFLSFHDKDGHYRLEGGFLVQAESDVAWKVLTDYEHIPSFVSNMKKSLVLERLTNDLVLEQEMEGGFLFFTKRVNVLLNVRENPGQSISFQDRRHKDFQFYQGDWNLRPAAQGKVEVVYRLEAKQNFSLPFSGDFMQGGVKDLLAAVQREILKRQAKKIKENSIVLLPPPVQTQQSSKSIPH